MITKSYEDDVNLAARVAHSCASSAVFGAIRLRPTGERSSLNIHERHRHQEAGGRWGGGRFAQIYPPYRKKINKERPRHRRLLNQRSGPDPPAVEKKKENDNNNSPAG